METSIIKVDLYENIRTVIGETRKFTARPVNTIMVKSYWDIGRLIVEDEQDGKSRATFGEKVLENLSKQLTKEFGKGFAPTNLRKMRPFYVTYPIRDAVRLELSWTHYRSLLRVENPKARDFYLQEAIDSQWSTRQLNRQINSFYYERLLGSRNKAKVVDEAEQKKEIFEAKDVIKDPFVLEFLGLQDRAHLLEKDLEKALLDNLQLFLLELGRGFSFVARQKRITSATGKHYYIDLVFYNYILKCFVLIDLKMHELTHEDIDKMDIYVRYYEDKFKNEDDNPTIGINLCSEKGQAIVKYSVLEESKQLFASKYKLYLPTEEELALELKREIEQIKLLKALK